MKRIAIALCLVLAASVAVGRPRLAASTPEDVLRLGLPADPSSMNPLLIQNEADGTLADLIFSGLLRNPGDGKLAPDLAVAVPSTSNGGITADGKTIVFHLRHNVRWQDGAPFDARDVVFTYTELRNPKLDNAAAFLLIDSIASPDRWTVVFKLRKPDADALNDYFGGPIVVPRHVLAGVSDLNTAAFNMHPIGTGPYAFEDWQHGSWIDLHANPYYFGRTPAIPRLRLMFVQPVAGTMMLRTGEMDATVVEAGGVALLRGSSVRVQAYRRHSLQYVTLNTKRAPLDDVRVRQALESAIDRSRLITTVYHGNAVAADQLVPPYDWGYTPVSVSQPNLARARALLDAAGWKTGSDGIRTRNGRQLSFGVIYYSEQEVLRVLALQLQAAWASVGARAELRPMPVLAYTAKDGPLQTGKYDAVVASIGFASTSPDRAIMLDPRAPFDDANYDDAQIQRWDDAAEETYDPASRKALYALVEQRVARDVPFIPIAWADTVVGYTDRLAYVPVPRVGDVYSLVDEWTFRSPRPK